MTRFQSALTAAIVSVLVLFVYSRSGALYGLYANAPSRLHHINNIQDSHHVRFRNAVRNCEDILLEPRAGFALLSCDPGRDTWNTVMGTFINATAPAETGIYLWRYSVPHAQPVRLHGSDSMNADNFHPLGIEYHASSKTLAVINHAASGSTLELFTLSVDESTILHQRTIKHSLIAAPNSIAIHDDQGMKEIFISTDHYFLRRYSPALALAETYLTIPGGSIVHLDLHASANPKFTVVARLPFANGLVKLNASTLAVASSSANFVRLYRISRTAGAHAPRLTLIRTIHVPFHPDNLSVDQRGKLLIAGHPHAPTLERIAKQSARCNQLAQRSAESCEKGLSAIAEWSEEIGLVMLYVGDEYGSSTTAVRDNDRDVGFAVGLYERGILSWKD